MIFTKPDGVGELVQWRTPAITAGFGFPRDGSGSLFHNAAMETHWYYLTSPMAEVNLSNGGGGADLTATTGGFCGFSAAFADLCGEKANCISS